MGIFEFFRKRNMPSDTNKKILDSMIENATACVTALIHGNDSEADARALSLFNILRQDEKLILQFQPSQYNVLSRATGIMLSNQSIRNDEGKILAVANYNFYCLARAIEFDDKPIFRLMRISLLADTHEIFYQTVANAIGLSSEESTSAILFMSSSMPLIVRTNDYYCNMGYYDFENLGENNYEGNMAKFRRLVYQPIDIPNRSIVAGKQCVDTVFRYLEHVFQNDLR